MGFSSISLPLFLFLRLPYLGYAFFVSLASLAWRWAALTPNLPLARVLLLHFPLIFFSPIMIFLFARAACVCVFATSHGMQFPAPLRFASLIA